MKSARSPPAACENACESGGGAAAPGSDFTVWEAEVITAITTNSRLADTHSTSKLFGKMRVHRRELPNKLNALAEPLHYFATIFVCCGGRWGRRCRPTCTGAGRAEVTAGAGPRARAGAGCGGGYGKGGGEWVWVLAKFQVSERRSLKL